MNFQFSLPPFFRRRLFWTNLFLVIGSLLILIFGLRTFRSFQEINYAREQGLLDGSANPDAIRPWMTIQYIAVAYAVPEEYIVTELNIPLDNRNEYNTLGQLNKLYKWGANEAGEPIILDKTTAIILQYRKNPVATGLQKIHPWMSLQYIANSTGVPVNHLLTELNIPIGNEFKPLDRLSREFHYKDPDSLAKTIQQLLNQYDEEQ